jgi:hypothetical protein
MTTSSSALPRRYPGRLFLWLGLALTALGLAAYVMQLSQKNLTTPWYLPASATIGLLLVLVALFQARSVWRFLALVLVFLFAGAEWTFLLGTRLPDYSGPVAQGEAFPDFKTVQSDGTPFTQENLVGDKDTVMVFFRGRW